MLGLFQNHQHCAQLSRIKGIVQAKITWKTETLWMLSLKSQSRNVESLLLVTTSLCVGWQAAPVSSMSWPTRLCNNTWVSTCYGPPGFATPGYQHVMVQQAVLQHLGINMSGPTRWVTTPGYQHVIAHQAVWHLGINMLWPTRLFDTWVSTCHGPPGV